MQRYATILTLIAAAGSQAVARGSEFTILMKSNGESLAEIRLELKDDLATTRVAGEVEKFNLKELSWLDDRTGRWVTLAQCKAWAEQSRTKSKTSKSSAPAPVRDFLLWSLDPTFKIEKSNGTLKLTSGQVDYVIDGEASKTDVHRYFRYAVLNAYKKAMTEKKVPPFAELKAIEEMIALGHIPRRISITIPAIAEAPAIEVEISETKP